MNCIALEVKKSNNLLMCPSNMMGKTLSVVDAVVYSVWYSILIFVLFLIFVLLVSSFSFFRHCLENALYLTFHIVFVTHRCWAEESPSQQARIAFVSLIRSDVLKNCFDKKCISCPVSPLSSTNILVERLSSEESLILSYCVSEQLSWKASAHFSAQGSL